MTETAIHGLIRRLALAGASLEAIGQELIESDPALNEEQRSGLWLYACHHTLRRTESACPSAVGRVGAPG